MAVQSRGGVPRVLRASVDVAGRKHRFAALSIWLSVTVTTPLRLFFTEDDFTNDTNFAEVQAGQPFDGPVEAIEIWMKGDGGTSSVQVVVYHRKG